MIANPARWTKQLSLPQGAAALSQVQNKSGMGESGRRGNPVAWVSLEPDSTGCAWGKWRPGAGAVGSEKWGHEPQRQALIQPHMWLSGCTSEPAPTRSANFGRALPITKTRTKIGLDIGERQRHGFFDGLGTASKVRRAFPIYSLVIPTDELSFPPFALLAPFQLRRRPPDPESLTRPTTLERRPKWHRSISERRAGVASRLAVFSSLRAAAWPRLSRSSTTSAYVEPPRLSGDRKQREGTWDVLW